MKLQAGLTAPSAGWELFLQQEKASYLTLPEDRPWCRETTPVIILTRLCKDLAAQAERFLAEGGALVADADSRLFLPHALKNHPRVFNIERSVTAAAADRAKAVKVFNAAAGYPVEEICAREPKRVTKKLIRKALAAAFAVQGLPFVRLDYYPRGYRSVFLFRIDLDEYDPNDFSVLCGLLNRYRESMSCFPCMKTYENRLEELKRAVETGVEFGSHAYVHHVYHNEKQNNFNLDAAEKLLKRLTDRVRGFSGPHGTWHPTLQSVLEKRGYDYSSEFSLDYDNFPFYPVLGERASTVLQIPVHPVCEGVFLQAYPYQEAMFRDYFQKVITERVRRAKPILVFGHPTRRLGRYPAIVDNLYRDLEEQSSVWKIQFHQWAGWWKERNLMQPVLEWDEKQRRVRFVPDQASKLKSSYGEASFRVLFPESQRGEEILSAAGGLIRKADPSESSTSPEEDFEIGSPVAFSFMKKLKQSLKGNLDWEIKTPVNQLFVTDFPSAAKYLLRRTTDPFRRESSHANHGGMS